METKRCSKCGEEKPLTEFNKNKYHKDGLSSSCNLCLNNNAKEYRKNNPNWIKERRKIYYNKNKLQISEIQKLWRENNPEKREEIYRKKVVDCNSYYVKEKLIKQGFKKEQITPELIELKRMIIKTKRKIKDESKHN